MVAEHLEQRRRQYEFERGLADRLRALPPDRRLDAYQTTYDTLYTYLAGIGELHPELPRGDLGYSLDVLQSLLVHPSAVLEVASGTGHLALRLAALGHDVVATDLSEVPLGILRQRAEGTRLRVVKTNAITLDVAGEFDVVWSNDLVEHLHPDDTAQHLGAALRRLKPGGRYIVVTPNRHGGPYDISAGFDSVARGLHLREWSYRELERALLGAGFRHVSTTSPWSHLRWRIETRLGWSPRSDFTLGRTTLKRWIEPLLRVPGLRKIAHALGAHPVTLIAER